MRCLDYPLPLQSAMAHCPPSLEAAINLSAGTHSSALTSLPPPDLLGIWEELHPLAPSPLSSPQQPITRATDLCNSRTQLEKLQRLVAVWDQELQHDPAVAQACKPHVEASSSLNQASTKDSAALLQDLKLPRISFDADPDTSDPSHETDTWEATIINVKRHCSRFAADTSVPLMLQLCPLQRQYLDSSQPLVQHTIAACLFDVCCRVSASSSKWTHSGKALLPQLKLASLKQQHESLPSQSRQLAFLKPEPASCKPESFLPEQQQAFTSQTGHIARHLRTASQQTAATQISQSDSIPDTQGAAVLTSAEDSQAGDLAVGLESVQSSLAHLHITPPFYTRFPSTTRPREGQESLLPELQGQAPEVVTPPVASSKQPLSLYKKPSKRSLVQSRTATNATALFLSPKGTGWGQLPRPTGNLCCSTSLVEPQVGVKYILLDTHCKPHWCDVLLLCYPTVHLFVVCFHLWLSVSWFGVDCDQHRLRSMCLR